ncbi:winged helix-turn-helix domain-containing protein [Pseudoalteromonas denitrificans]|uniref:DNA-binding winged helix-turn-helix (WHTH) domain-containing protein n=1 Tax=Pseudoalteromonas denitrificans DSM 6059 TaxID=1123010 RepID=A0A1I1SEY0_9GAMM|nr:transcriptional regulator [Pseudoalteromonas denitrificans]SFD42403.1 DNA-binding winged helix-turn-helix (wHTH) domain-containing protein [Pseudoalteromonas denitrificans DSM 6059]
MAEQYWIGGFFIDLSRNQITQNKQSQIIAPKALAVLTYLAENQGKVVSHDALLAKVWQDTVVSPNTLQRSIAQIRKALGDDSKVQVYIKTHAKQGYSLECDVRWHDEIDLKAQDNTTPEITSEAIVEAVRGSACTHDPQENEAGKTDTNTTDKPSRSGIKLISIIFGILILSIMGYQYFVPKQASQFSFGELRALTSTDNKELASIYSPDGEYIVFHRYSEEFCINNVWAKNTKTQQEFQLTKNLDSYGSHSFSKDGKNLVFIKTGGCSKPITQKKCYKLMNLDFNKALVSPQTPSVLMECKNSQIRNPNWLNNNNIALLQKTSERWKLISYSVNENKSQVLYAPDDSNILDYDYSVKDDLIALTSIHTDGQYYIEVLKADGQVLSSHQINYPKEIAKFRLIYPNFSPFKNQLIFSTGKQLFTLSHEGQVNNISLPLDESLGSPKFHPDGNRMIVIKGHYDSDIATVPISQITQTQPEEAQNKQSTHFSVIDRSILAEDNAILQPNGKLIAYKSERSGDEQLWITDGKSAQQLTHLPMDAYLFGMDWAADGKSILINANNELTQVYLDLKQKPFPMDYPVVRLFQWDSKNNSALLLIRIKGILKFVEFNLTNSEFRIISDKRVNWALKSESGQLIYKDHMDRFWQPGPAEDQLIEALDGQGSSKKGFVINDNVIYGINDSFQLWSYALNEELFEIIGKLPSNVDDLTDINQDQLFITIRVSSNKEVVELTLNE